MENVYCPYLGDVQHPPQAEWLKTFVYNYAAAQEWPVWPQFQNMRGYYGVDYPTQISAWSAGVGAPMAPYILLRSPQQGLYVGVNAPSSELVAWHLELRPGWGESINAQQPRTRTIAGEDVAVRFAAVHVPYIQPGETRTLTPIAVEAYRGGWQAGVDIYKALARLLDGARHDPRLGARAAQLAADPHQLARGRAARPVHRAGPHRRGVRPPRRQGHPARRLERRRPGPGQPLARPRPAPRHL